MGSDIDIDIHIDVDEERRRRWRRLRTFDIAFVGPLRAFALSEDPEQMADIAITLLDTEQTVVRSSNGRDAAGQPIAGVTFAYAAPADTSVVALTDNGDGTAAVVSGAPGTTTFVVTATAPDGSTVSSTVTVTVNAGPLAAFDIVADPATPKA
jgi:hypothetical protein